ncbi:MAG: hypothetical protein HY934_08810, partial [Candidatus Firestonebacteria bacterium]|nr:hypothetical protein [Candidatus Firestonebacteria bacterium]
HVIYNNVIGATTDTLKRSLPFIPSNNNSIFISKSGSDSGIIISQIQTMTSATGVNGILASNGGEAAGKEPWRMFDDTNASWYEGGVTTYDANYIIYQFMEKKIFSYFTVKSPGTVLPQNSMPYSYKIYGSNDGSVYALIQSISDSSSTWAANELRAYYLNDKVKYIYYKIVINSPSGSVKPCIGELKLYGEQSAIGTIEAPCLTIKEGVYRCNLEQKDYVVINDNGLYEENPITVSSTDYCKGIIANIGYSPVFSLTKNLDDFKFISNLATGIISLNQTSPLGINEKEIQFATYDGVNAIVSYQPLMLDDGTIGVPYSKGNELHYRIYNATLTVPILDVLVITGTGSAKGQEDNPFILSGDFVIGMMANLTVKFNNKTGAIVYSGATSYRNIVKINDTLFGLKLGTTNPQFLVFDGSGSGLGTLKKTITSPNPNIMYSGFIEDHIYVYLCSPNASTPRDIVKIKIADWTHATITMPVGRAVFRIILFKFNNKYFTLEPDFGITEVANFTTFAITKQWLPANNGLGSYFAYSSIDVSIPSTFLLNESKMLVLTSASNASGTYTIAVLDFLKWDTASFVHCKQVLTSMVSPENLFPFWHIGNNKFYEKNSAFVTSSGNRGIRLFELFETTFINTEKELLLDDIIFNPKKDGRIKDIIKTIESITIKNCSFKNVYNENEGLKFPSYILRASANKQIVVQNCFVDNVDKGFKIVSNACSFMYNLITRVKGSTALEVTGAGANIIINHNTFHNNYAGVELIGNNGTETIKNNIFYYNTVFGVKTAVTLLIKNNCCSDYLLGATLDSSSNQLNPLFKNNGFVNPEQINLHLQTNYEGYSINSPALIISDDGKDAGCYDTTAVIAPPTYTSCFIPKPKKIGITVIPVGEVFNTMQDGSVESRVDAFQLQVDLDYDSMRTIYIDDLIKMITAGGEARIYFSPYTDPSMFESMYLKYKDYPFINDVYSLAEYGYKDLKLTFVRKFDREELN